MRLGTADIAVLPLAAALFDRDGALLACSPEWTGGGLGTVRYRLPTTSLAVAADEQDSVVAGLLAELVDTITSAARASQADKRLRLEVLAASVALVAGIPQLQPGATAEVLERLSAVLATVSHNPVTISQHHAGTVADASLTALALRQLVVNARRHDDAARVTLSIQPGPTFTLEWLGRPLHGVTTSRHQADRARWGLGFVRLAMDALGGVYLAPAAASGHGQLRAVLAIDGSRRLQLPVAAVRDGVVARASPAWDEETHAPPGSPLPERWRHVTDAASRRPGQIARDGSRRARTAGRTTWAAIPAEGTVDRARDVIRELDHEPDLLDVAPQSATAIRGLAAVLALLLGDPAQRVSPAAFNAEYPAMASQLHAPSLPHAFTGPAAPEPALVAFLAARFDASLEYHDDRLRIHFGHVRKDDPIARRLADADGLLSLP